jgi:hypothetical protein
MMRTKVALMVTIACGSAPAATKRHAGEHRVDYEHCSDAAGSQQIMREHGYELLATDRLGSISIQHWHLRRHDPSAPRRIDLRLDGTDACIADTVW